MRVVVYSSEYTTCLKRKMTQYITIDANDSLSFFMGSWRELHLHEFEFSDSALSSEDGIDNDDSTSGTSATSSTTPRQRRKVAAVPRSASRNRIPDDWLSLTESPQKQKKPIRTDSNNRVTTPKTNKK